MFVSCKCMGLPVNQGGTADKIYSSLTEDRDLFVRGFFIAFGEKEAGGDKNESSTVNRRGQRICEDRQV